VIFFSNMPTCECGRRYRPADILNQRQKSMASKCPEPSRQMVIEVKEPNGAPSATKTVRVISQSIKVAPIVTTKSIPVDQRTPKHYRRVSKTHSMSPEGSHGEDLPSPLPPSSPRSPRSPRSPKAIEFPMDGKQTQGKVRETLFWAFTLFRAPLTLSRGQREEGENPSVFMTSEIG